MLLVLLSAEVAPILSATPAVITAVARFLTVLLLPSSLKVLPRLPLLLTKLIEAWVASDRKAAFAMAAEVPVTTVPLGKCRCLGSVHISSVRKILSAKARLQGEKRSKVGHLASIFNAAGAFLSQKIATR